MGMGSSTPGGKLNEFLRLIETFYPNQRTAQARRAVELAQTDPALARKIEAAVDATEDLGHGRPLVGAMVDVDIPPPPRPGMVTAGEVPVGRDPVPFAERIAGEPKIRQGLEDVGVPTEGLNQGELLDEAARVFSSPLGAEEGLAARLAESAPPRAYQVPFAEERGLVPFGVRGPGTPVGGPTGAGVLMPESRALSTQVTPRTGLPGPPARGLVPQERGLIPQERGLSTIPDAPRRPRLEGPEQLRIEGPEQLRIEGPRRAGIEAPGVAAERNAMDDLARAVDADAARRRVPRDGDFRLDPSQRQAGGGWKRAAAGAAAVAGGAAGVKLGLDAMWPMLGGRDEEGRSTADLAAEQNPPPTVMTEEPEPIRPAAPMTPPEAPVDYSAMARDKIRQANEIQRREGRITPESAALTREADALYRRSADERAAGRGQPIMPSEQANDQTSAVRAEGRRQMAQNPGSDPRSQARHLLGRINAGEFGNGPQRQQAVNEVNRLFAMADAQRYGR